MGNGGDDILVAGRTAYDNDPAALRALQAEWGRTDIAYAGRIGHLVGSSAGGRNGATLLTTSSVFNDSAVDILTGAAGQDWFLANTAGAGVRDNMTDAAGEMITDLL